MYSNLSKYTLLAKLNINYCSGEREEKINNEKIVTVKAMLKLDGRADVLRECRTPSDQGKERSSSSVITYSVSAIKRMTNKKCFQTFSALFRDFLKHFGINAQKVEVTFAKKKKRATTFNLKTLLRRFCVSVCYGVNYQHEFLLRGLFFSFMLQFFSSCFLFLEAYAVQVFAGTDGQPGMQGSVITNNNSI